MTVAADTATSRWNPRYVPQLDGLRSLAVGLVVVYHALRSDSGKPWFPGAFLGVDVFFVLSGFLITSLLLAEHRREGRIRLLAFYRRRFWRLYPGLVLVCLGTVVLFQVIGHPDNPAVAQAQSENPRGLLYALTYLMSWAFAFDWQQGALGHTWSLSVEEHFYLVWPAVLLLVLRRPSKQLVGWVTGLALAAALWPVVFRLALHPTANRIYAGPDTRCGQMMVGVLLATLMARPQGLGRLRWLLSGWVTTGAGLLLLASAGIWHRKGFPYLTGGQSLLAGCSALLLASLVLRETWLSRLLAQRPFVAVGRWSYGIYLWHIPIVIIPAEVVGHGLWVRVVGAVLSVPIAAASYRFVEAPLLRRYGGARTAPETAPTPVAGEERPDPVAAR